METEKPALRSFQEIDFRLSSPLCSIMIFALSLNSSCYYLYTAKLISIITGWYINSRCFLLLYTIISKMYIDSPVT